MNYRRVGEGKNEKEKEERGNRQMIEKRRGDGEKRKILQGIGSLRGEHCFTTIHSSFLWSQILVFVAFSSDFASPIQGDHFSVASILYSKFVATCAV
jgi:hypothetical protein